MYGVSKATSPHPVGVETFTAGLIYKLIKQGKDKFFANMKANMIFASAVSAVICAKKGSYQGLKGLKQVKNIIEKSIWEI